MSRKKGPLTKRAKKNLITLFALFLQGSKVRGNVQNSMTSVAGQVWYAQFAHQMHRVMYSCPSWSLYSTEKSNKFHNDLCVCHCAAVYLHSCGSAQLSSCCRAQLPHKQSSLTYCAKLSTCKQPLLSHFFNCTD